MADPFCDRPGSEDDSTDLCGCQRDPWIYIHFVDYSDCILLPCCLLYTSDAADEEDSVDLCGRRILKKKKKITQQRRPYLQKNTNITVERSKREL